jgi:uncharacterized protein (TIGR04255 family)
VQWALPQIERWDPLQSAELYGRLREILDGEPTNQVVMVDTPVFHGGQVQSVATPVIRTSFVSSDARLALLMGPVHSIHFNRPYHGWDAEIFPLTINVIDAIESTYGPRLFHHVMVRYINDIGLPPSNESIEVYLNSFPNVPPLRSSVVAGFLQQMHFIYEKEQANLSITYQNMPRNDGKFGVRLDLIVQHDASAAPMRREQALDKIQELKDIERFAFESCITDRMRDEFDA